MDKHAVVKMASFGAKLTVRVFVVTPWFYNKALTEVMLEAHRELDPASTYGILTLSETALRGRRK